MKKTLFYLFDPLCAWCYGISPAISTIATQPNIELVMLPTGLFSRGKLKVMNEEFATFAWRNDERIANLTGQLFTERYRELVLGNHKQMIDSEPATLALTAVYLTMPAREFECLKAIQRARYVDGKNVTDISVLLAVLRSLELNEAATKLERSDTLLLTAKQRRIDQAQAMLKIFNAQGVPTLIVETGNQRHKLDTSEIYGNHQQLIHQLQLTESISST